jgi:hypothetical protein
MEANYDEIKRDMEKRNNSVKRRTSSDKSSTSVDSQISSVSCSSLLQEGGDVEVVVDGITIPPMLGSGGKTRKKREELSTSACLSMRFERNAPITFKFGKN